MMRSVPPSVCAGRIVVREVTVRPIRDVAERRRWDELMSAFHYLPFNGLFGQSLRHVAEYQGRWVALLGWTAGAFKVGVRDRWIGWSRDHQFRRLKLIANNARFVVLGGRGETPNLASRVLGLSVRRLSSDMRTMHGFPVLLAETFVDPSRYAGSGYRASNWRKLGETRGFTRGGGHPVRWIENGQPKEVYVMRLQSDACAALRGDLEPVEWGLGAKADPMPATQLRSLRDFLEGMPDFRKARGQRYSLACYLTIAMAARLAGYRGVAAFGEFAERLDEGQRRAVGGFVSPTRHRITVPAASTFHYLLEALPPDTLEQALRAWTAQHDSGAPVAMDGKDIRGASRQIDGEKRLMVGAVEHGRGVVLGQRQVGDKTNEIPAVRELAKPLDLAGRVVTLDAMHAQQATARCLVEQCHAHYVMTAVKDNQPTLRDDLAAIDWTAARHGETVEKGHGRIETRQCAVVDLSAPAWNGWCNLFGRRQAIRLERERYLIKTDKTTRETTYCLTSLGADEAGPEALLNLVRQHWHIENKEVHYVRDFSDDEDRCRVSVGHLPRNLAALSNAAISLVRMMDPFQCLPPAHRHYAARPQEALDAILT